jgi:hypothetical protein
MDAVNLKLADELSREFVVESRVTEIGSQKHLITYVDARKFKFLIVEMLGVGNEISFQDMDQYKQQILRSSLGSDVPVFAFHVLKQKPTDDEARSFFHRGFDDWLPSSMNVQVLKILIEVLSYQGPCIDYKKISSLESQTSGSCVTDLFEALLKDCTDAKSKVFQIGPDGAECTLKIVNCDLHVCSQIIGNSYLFQLCEFINSRIQQGPPWSKFFQEIIYQGLEKLTKELTQLQSKRPHYIFC